MICWYLSAWLYCMSQIDLPRFFLLEVSDPHEMETRLFFSFVRSAVASARRNCCCNAWCAVVAKVDQLLLREMIR